MVIEERARPEKNPKAYPYGDEGKKETTGPTGGRGNNLQDLLFF